MSTQNDDIETMLIDTENEFDRESGSIFDDLRLNIITPFEASDVNLNFKILVCALFLFFYFQVTTKICEHP
jgi:hypothetical protein